MRKVDFKPGNMLYPLPAVLISVGDMQGESNLFTVAWTGTICSDPPMVSISVRKSRYSHHMIMESGEFIINLTTEDLVFATDFCGVRSGKDIDKWSYLGLHKLPGKEVKAPRLSESPVHIECRVEQVLELGTHDMFIAKVVAVSVDDAYMDEKGSFHLEKANPIVYSHGTYYQMGKSLGKFGYSVQKEKKNRNNKRKS